MLMLVLLSLLAMMVVTIRRGASNGGSGGRQGRGTGRGTPSGKVEDKSRSNFWLPNRH